jgi:putative transposase
VKPVKKRELVRFLMIGFQIGQRRACRALGFSRSTIRYQSRAKEQNALRIRLRDLAGSRIRWGYRRLHVLLQREGWKINHKRVYRLYKQEGLELRIERHRKKRTAAPQVPWPPALAPNDRWSMDFLSDRMSCGRAFRVLALVDNVSRVNPAIEADVSMTGRRVTEILERAVAQ